MLTPQEIWIQKVNADRAARKAAYDALRVKSPAVNVPVVPDPATIPTHGGGGNK